MKEEDDATLVQRSLQGEGTAFGQLVGRYQRTIFNAAMRMLRNADDARDVTQTAFLKAFEHLRDYDPAFRFYSWLYRIAVNESLDALGSRKSADALNGGEPDESPGPEGRAEGEQTGRAIEAALMRINPELRSVIVLRHVVHLSYHEMADILQLPEKTVKSRLYTARQLLREQLRDYQGH